MNINNPHPLVLFAIGAVLLVVLFSYSSLLSANQGLVDLREAGCKTNDTSAVNSSSSAAANAAPQEKQLDSTPTATILTRTLVLQASPAPTEKQLDSTPNAVFLTRTLVLQASPSALPPSSAPKKIAIMTLVIGDQGFVNSEAARISLDSKKRYCEQYGYELVIIRERLHPELNVAWEKIYWLNKIIDKYSWIWALDLDAFIMNKNMRIEDHVLGNLKKKDTADFIISQDCNGFNAGSFLVRNSEWSKWFLMEVWGLRLNKDFHQWDLFYEQAGISHAIKNGEKDGFHLDLDFFNFPDRSMENHTEIVAQNLINSYPFTYCGASFQLGDFVMHFAGVPNKEVEMLKHVKKQDGQEWKYADLFP